MLEAWFAYLTYRVVIEEGRVLFVKGMRFPRWCPRIKVVCGERELEYILLSLIINFIGNRVSPTLLPRFIVLGLVLFGHP